MAKIRQETLEKHLCYTRLRTDNDFENLTGDEIINELQKLGGTTNCGCPIHCNLIHDLGHSYSPQNMFLEDRINKNLIN